MRRHQPHRKYAIPTICNKIISGMPYLNFRCSVLCLNAIIPHNAPRLPPIIANPSRVRSGTLHQCFMAQYLSHPYNRNVPILIITKYLMNSFTIIPPSSTCLPFYPLQPNNVTFVLSYHKNTIEAHLPYASSHSS